ncbi:MAG TPA: alkyl sulfatase dimerization domain-containing protein [Polyangia bacterium]|nr:alkyl sulfatase dimerization domain-containing protein [Polyangia bacterium]
MLDRLGVNVGTGLVLASVLLAGGCSPSARGETGATGAAPQPASDVTRRAQSEQLRTAPFSDKRDFANARRGLIAPLPNDGVIKDASGKVVWNLKALTDFVSQAGSAPETVNPSLWRMAQLLTISGLFEVVPGVYQVRGADLSNLTIVEGRKGLTIYDPLVSTETARAALALYYQHRPRKPVVAVIYSHSHVDHFGGVRGVVDKSDVEAGKVRIYAPDHFLEEAVSENVFAGTAMSRRASYMYGYLVPPGPKGQATAGLGPATSSGTVSLIAPTDLIKTTGERRTIDGLEYEFVMAPGSEAPSEMMWFVREKKLLNTAEDATHTMHNLYTLRGAKTRDAARWPAYLNEVIRRYGDKAEVEIGMHHWPTWGSAEIVQHIKAQRDVYKFLHDQTLHFANQGYTMNELPDLVKIPEELEDTWAVRGYYGSQSHNVRAVYNYYLGYFDGNPAHLDPLPPREAAKRYLRAMGGRDGVLAEGRRALATGDYRWGAEVVNYLVFAAPADQEAKNLQADILEQLGYQAESATWRNFYLSGAQELREGVVKSAAASTASADVIGNMSLDLVFDYLGIRLNADRAGGKKITLNFNVPDTKQQYALFLEHSVLNAWPHYQDDKADATITADRSTLNRIVAKELTPADAIRNGAVRVSGSTEKVNELLACLDDLNESLWFNIVTP